MGEEVLYFLLSVRFLCAKKNSFLRILTELLTTFIVISHLCLQKEYKAVPDCIWHYSNIDLSCAGFGSFLCRRTFLKNGQVDKIRVFVFAGSRKSHSWHLTRTRNFSSAIRSVLTSVQNILKALISHFTVQDTCLIILPHSWKNKHPKTLKPIVEEINAGLISTPWSYWMCGWQKITHY